MNFLGSLLRQQLCYPSKLHGKGHHRTMPNLSDWRRRGWEAAFSAGWELGDTCETTASLRCHGAGKTQTAHHFAWSGFCQRCAYSAEPESQKQRKVLTKKPWIWEMGLQCSDLSPLWTQTNVELQKKEGAAFKFHSFSISANLPWQNINLWWETSFKQDVSVQKIINTDVPS